MGEFPSDEESVYDRSTAAGSAWTNTNNTMQSDNDQEGDPAGFEEGWEHILWETAERSGNATSAAAADAAAAATTAPNNNLRAANNNHFYRTGSTFGTFSSETSSIDAESANASDASDASVESNSISSADSGRRSSSERSSSEWDLSEIEEFETEEGNITFTSRGGAIADMFQEDNGSERMTNIDTAADHSPNDYQVAVERNADGTYEVKTRPSNMDEVVRDMCFSSSAKQSDTKISENTKANNAYDFQSFDIFRTHGKKSSKQDDDIMSPPAIALSSSSSSMSSSSDWMADYMDGLGSMKIRRRASRRHTLVAPCTFAIALLCSIGLFLASSNKLTSTFVHDQNIREVITTAIDECALVVQSKGGHGGGAIAFQLFARLVVLVKDLVSLEMWRDRATNLLSGALQTHWAEW